MDTAQLKAKLDAERTTLVLGDVVEKVLVAHIPEPLGFIAGDLDFYSSTAGALRIFRRRDVRRLRRVAMY
jgi:hypothetical protein